MPLNPQVGEEFLMCITVWINRMLTMFVCNMWYIIKSACYFLRDSVGRRSDVTATLNIAFKHTVNPAGREGGGINGFKCPIRTLTEVIACFTKAVVGATLLRGGIIIH